MRVRVIITVLILIMLPVTVFLLLQRTGLINRAAAPEEEGGIATISLDPQSSSAEVGEEFDVHIKLDTQNIGVSIAQVHLTYTYEGETPPFEVVDALGTKADLIQIQPGTIDSLNFVTNDVTDNPAPGTEQHQVIIRLDGVIADDTQPFISNGEEVFGTITFRANKTSKETSLRFDPDLSKITTFDTGQDVLLIPTNATITITGEGGTSAPQISSIYPTRGLIGNTLIVEGGNFGEEQGTSSVSITGTEVNDIRNWTENSITLLIPTGATTGKVSVTTEGGTALSTEMLTIDGADPDSQAKESETAPRIESFLPKEGLGSTPITLIGSNFGTEQGTSLLFLGDKPIVDILTWSNVLLEFRIPTSAKTDQITLKTDSGESTTTECLVVAGTTSANQACTAQAFSLSGVQANVTDTQADITWTSAELASSQVLYGVSKTYTKQTDVDDTDPRVTQHTMTLADLLPCTTYHFDVKSENSDEGVATSGDKTFTTSGCIGEANVVSTSTKTVSAAVGGTLSLTDNNESVTVDAPINYTTGETTIQIKKLESTQVTTKINPPENKVAVGGNLYELGALDENEEQVTSFITPLTVSMKYDTNDLGDIDAETLTIHRWDGQSWAALDDCVVDTQNTTVTCTTINFSTFGLFGEEVVVASGTETVPPIPVTPPPTTTQQEVTPSGTPESTPTPTPIPATGVEEYTRILTYIGIAFVIMGMAFPTITHLLAHRKAHGKDDYY